MTKHKWMLAGVALLMVLGAACGSADEDGGSSDTVDAAAGGDEALTITAPEDGAELTVPFTLELSSADPLGAPDTGNHHVHVFYDEDDSEYEVVTTDTFEVSGLSPGHHSVTASLRNADHSPAGTDVTVHLVVLEGDDTGGSKSKDSGETNDNGSDDTNYGY